ncbi:RHS repeat-associated core domain-containing protein [Actinoplanes sp. NPDC051494]|uniref:RHS repeat-associated core domain-containing protein n=1 Tax=Actinoplanes sp. NPDC051494 TaxID=3363907 RepID=UPI0037AF4B41
MTTRPGAGEWSVLHLDSDPVPGDSESFADITRAYQELARTTQEAHDLLASGGRIDVGQGKAMEAFKDLIGKLPPRLDVMAQSYSRAADAYLAYLPSLEEAQLISLRALDQARQAADDQSASSAALRIATDAVKALGGDAAPADDTAADDAAAARRSQEDASQALDSAISLVKQATALRDQAARTAARVLDELADDAPQRSLWEKIKEAFQAFVDFLRSTVLEWITLVLDALSVIASLIFPPLGSAIGFLSGTLEFLGAVAGGVATEIGLAAGGILLGLVPGGRIAARLIKITANIATSVKTATKVTMKGFPAAGKTIGGGFPGRGVTGSGANRPPDPVPVSRDIDLRDCVSDPVDVATGEMVLEQWDLGLERVHVSSYRAGGWFGSSWASLLDERIETDADGACWFAPDGKILVYPEGLPGVPVLPVEGPRIALTRYLDGSAELRDPGTGRTWSFQNGLLTAIRAADGTGTGIERDDQARPVVVTLPDGRRVEVTTADGRVTSLRSGPTEILFGYDDSRRLTTVTDDTGPYRYGYDDESRITSWTDRSGYRYRYTYDTDGRCVRTEGDRGFLTATFVYDAEQRRTEHTDSLGGTSVYLFDEHNRTISRTDPLGHTTRWAWDRYGRLLGRTDPLGATTRYRYDDDGTLVSVVRPDGSAVEVEGTRIQVSGIIRDYDGTLPDDLGTALAFEDLFPEDDDDDDTGRSVATGRATGPFGELLAEVDGAGARTTYEYDTELRLVAVTNPAGQLWRYAYDAVGNLVEETNFDGRVLRFSYDAAGRLASTVDGLGATTAYRYDSLGNLVGRTTPDGTTTYRYDPAGRLIAAAGPDAELTLTRDRLGRVTAQTVDGHRVEFGYLDTRATVRRRTPGGTESTWRFDGSGRSDVLTVGGYTRAFGTGGRAEPVTPGLDLDPAGRVVAVHRSGTTERYEYDVRGNLLGTGVNYTEDAQGRVVSRTVGGRTWVFTWATGDRLVAAHTPDGDDWRYRYDPFGRRIAKVRMAGAAEAERVDFIWDGTVLIEQIHTGPDGARTVTTWQHDQDQRPVAQSSGDEFFAIVTDLVGTPVELLTADGTPVWRSSASLWGAEPEPAPTPLRFPGQYFDAETGLHYNVYRYYDPLTARYLSQDPLGLAPAPNPVAYVPNPFAAADPLGLKKNKGKGKAPAKDEPAPVCNKKKKGGNNPGAGNDAAGASSSASSSGKNASKTMVEDPNAVVRLDNHQLKHQPGLFPEDWGNYRGDRGSQFPASYGVNFHKAYMAPKAKLIAEAYLEEIKQSQPALYKDILAGKKTGTPAKTKDYLGEDDGITYDVAVSYEDGKMVVDYHGNPKIDRNSSQEEWQRTYGKKIEKKYGNGSGGFPDPAGTGTAGGSKPRGRRG